MSTPASPYPYRVVRGGSRWGVRALARVANCDGYAPVGRFAFLGLRLVAIPGFNRVVRGGCWWGAPANARVAFRFRCAPGGGLGLRLVGGAR